MMWTNTHTRTRHTEPSVIAEVITGILLGPSVMGFVPGFTKNIFPPTSITIFNGTTTPRSSYALRVCVRAHTVCVCACVY
jgi:hypothetical protein